MVSSVSSGAQRPASETFRLQGRKAFSQATLLHTADRFLYDSVNAGNQAARAPRVAAVAGTENFSQVGFLQANPPTNQKNRSQQ